MSDIVYIDRKTKKQEREKVYGQFFLELLYGDGFLRRFLSFFPFALVRQNPFFLLGLWGVSKKQPQQAQSSSLRPQIPCRCLRIFKSSWIVYLF